MNIDLSLVNVGIAIVCAFVIPGAGAYIALKLSDRDNSKDHEVYDNRFTEQAKRDEKQDDTIKALDERVASVEKGMIKVFTLVENLCKRLDKIDNKLITLCDNVSKLIGKLE